MQTSPVSQLNPADFFEFVKKAHEGQIDAAGAPYVDHLVRVQDRVKAKLEELPEGILSKEDQEEALLLALGHDLLEDTEVTGDMLKAIGASETFITRLRLLSRLEPKPMYQDFIRTIANSGDIVPIIVKLSDNEDNNDLQRIAQLPVERRTITKRYDRAHFILSAEIERILNRFSSRDQDHTIGRCTAVS